MSLIWMPPHTTTPPLRDAFSAAGTRAPTGAKMMAASSCSGGISSEPPAHAAPSARAKSCARRIAGPREGEDFAALMPRHLRHDMRRRAEAVDAEARASPVIFSER